MGNGILGTQGMRRMLYYRVCRKHSGKSLQTFRGISSNILDNVANIRWNVPKRSKECRQTFREHYQTCFQENFLKHTFAHGVTPRNKGVG